MAFYSIEHTKVKHKKMTHTRVSKITSCQGKIKSCLMSRASVMCSALASHMLLTADTGSWNRQYLFHKHSKLGKLRLPVLSDSGQEDYSRDNHNTHLVCSLCAGKQL